MARLAIHNLCKTFASPKRATICAVNDANFTVEDGEFLVLVGPSGCGKSTLLRMIAGLEDITRGRLTVDGHEMNAVPAKDRDVAMVFQNQALYPHLTVYENIALGLRLRKVPRPEIDRRVSDATQALGLTTCLDRLPGTLSGGERQRAALGRAMVRRPGLFLLDEPLSNLDTQMRVQMRAELRRLHDRLGATMIYVTHDQAEAMTMGDRIAVMRAGTIQQVAVPPEVYHRPANLFVAGFIGSPPMNLFQGRLVRQLGALWFEEQSDIVKPAAAGFRVRLSTDQACNLERAPSRPLMLGLRPEHITCMADRPLEANELTAVVDFTATTGAETHLHLTTAQHSLVARIPSDFQASPGQRVTLMWDLARAHFFDPATGSAVSPTEAAAFPSSFPASRKTG